MLRLGLACIFAEPSIEPAARIDELVALATDPRWPVQPQLLNVGGIAGKPSPPKRRGKIPAREVGEAIRAALSAETASDVRLAVSREDDANRAWLRIDTGRYASAWDRVPFELLAHVEAGPSSSKWIELAHDLVRAVRGVHGVIVATSNRFLLSDELWLQTSTLNGKLTHEYAAEIQRISKHRRELGVKYVRPPRWGNYLPRWAVEAIGGRAMIESRVAPPVIREVGDLTYVQLSARAEDALAPETEAKRRAFADLLAPIIVPTKTP